eukprot:COSAG01_NODE_9643_length_2381_cov_140.677914_2_plen_202_part_00
MQPIGRNAVGARGHGRPGQLCGIGYLAVLHECQCNGARARQLDSRWVHIPGSLLCGCALRLDPYLQCAIDYTPASNASTAFCEVPVSCGGTTDMLRLLPSETTVELRVFADHLLIEAFFQRGRVAMTAPIISPDDMAHHEYLSDSADIGIISTVNITTNVTLFPMAGIWVSEEEVKNAKRVFPKMGVDDALGSAPSSRVKV